MTFEEFANHLCIEEDLHMQNKLKEQNDHCILGSCNGGWPS